MILPQGSKCVILNVFNARTLHDLTNHKARRHITPDRGFRNRCCDGRFSDARLEISHIGRGPFTPCNLVVPSIYAQRNSCVLWWIRRPRGTRQKGARKTHRRLVNQHDLIPLFAHTDVHRASSVVTYARSFADVLHSGPIGFHDQHWKNVSERARLPLAPPSSLPMHRSYRATFTHTKCEKRRVVDDRRIGTAISLRASTEKSPACGTNMCKVKGRRNGNRGDVISRETKPKRDSR